MSNISWRGRSGFLSRLRGESPIAVTAMVAVLLTYASALLLQNVAAYYVDVVIQATVYGWLLSRILRRSTPFDRLLSFLILPSAAFASTELDTLLKDDFGVGASVFVAAMFGSIYLRRFGQRASKAGTVAILPCIAILTAQLPFQLPDDGNHRWWVALIALIACFWVNVVLLGAERSGFVSQPTLVAANKRRPGTTPEATAARRDRGGLGGRGPSWLRTPRLSASTRMAAQMAVALGSAFAVSHWWFPDHWTWAVLTAFIVCSGVQGRLDAVHKGLHRAVGVAVGTSAATWIGGYFERDDAAAVVLIFVLLAIGTWLRDIGYAWWAACVTAVLALMYDYFGQDSADALVTRLQAICSGVTVAILACWLVVPITTTDVVRRRTADALAALSAVLGAPVPQPLDVERQLAILGSLVKQLDGVSRPLRIQRCLTRWWGGASRQLTVIEAVRQCLAPLRLLVQLASVHGGRSGTDPRVDRITRGVVANAIAVRYAIAGQPSRGYKPLPDSVHQLAEGQPGAIQALVTIDDALGQLSRCYPVRVPVPDDKDHSVVIGNCEPGTTRSVSN